MAPPSVDEPFIVMADAGDDPLVTCSGSGPFPLSALEGPPDVDPDSDDPLHQVLLSSTFEGGQPTPQEGWATATRPVDLRGAASCSLSPMESTS